MRDPVTSRHTGHLQHHPTIGVVKQQHLIAKEYGRQAHRLVDRAQISNEMLAPWILSSGALLLRDRLKVLSHR